MTLKVITTSELAKWSKDQWVKEVCEAYGPYMIGDIPDAVDIRWCQRYIAWMDMWMGGNTNEMSQYDINWFWREKWYEFQAHHTVEILDRGTRSFVIRPPT